MAVKSKTIYALKLSIALLAFGYLFWKIDFRAAGEALSRAHMHLLLVAGIVTLLGISFAALRWINLLKGAAIHLTFQLAYRTYLIGNFYGLVMPGVIGGDVVRTWICMRVTNASLSQSSISVLSERVLGFVVLLVVLNISSWFQVQNGTADLSWVPTLTSLAVVLLFISPLLFLKLQSKSSRYPTLAGLLQKPLLISVVSAFSIFRRERLPQLLFCVLLTFAFQCSDILATFFIARAIDVQLSFGQLFVALPIAYIATMLPISPGGLGVRELSFALVLSKFGISVSDASILAILVFLNRSFVGAVGGLMQMRHGKQFAKQEAR